MRPQPDGTNKYVKPGGSRGRYFSMQSDPEFEQDLETFGSTLPGDWSKAEIIREAVARACGRARSVEIVPVIGMEGPKPRTKSGYTQSDREFGGQKVSRTTAGNAEMGPGNTSGNFSEELVEVPGNTPDWPSNWSEETINRLKMTSPARQQQALNGGWSEEFLKNMLNTHWAPKLPAGETEETK